MDIKTFSRTLANWFECAAGDMFETWMREQVTLDSYDPLNPHNTSRNEGRRSAFREILHFVDQGRNPEPYPEKANEAPQEETEQ